MPTFRAPEFWRGPKPGAAAQLLRPVAAVYGALAGARLARTAPRAPLPAIVVGGACAGGDGKTPLALAIAALLQEMGERPFFLTRGYGGAARGAPALVDPARHDARRVGDEALLLAARAPTVVGADRLAAARLAAASGASALVLDDGLHSRRLAPDLALLAFDADYGFGDGLCLPAGPLRAPLAALARVVDAVVVVGGAAAPFAKPSFGAQLALRAPPGDVAHRRLAHRRLFGFCGIARPEKFRRSLIAAGATLAGFSAFADHHAYSQADLDALRRAAKRAGAGLATTEKDAARLGAATTESLAAAVLAVDLVFDDPQQMRALLAGALSRRA
jgi:tetraacyldisaccharide 4'-kinase